MVLVMVVTLLTNQMVGLQEHHNRSPHHPLRDPSAKYVIEWAIVRLIPIIAWIMPIKVAFHHSSLPPWLPPTHPPPSKPGILT